MNDPMDDIWPPEFSGEPIEPDITVYGFFIDTKDTLLKITTRIRNGKHYVKEVYNVFNKTLTSSLPINSVYPNIYIALTGSKEHDWFTELSKDAQKTTSHIEMYSHQCNFQAYLSSILNNRTTSFDFEDSYKNSFISLQKFLNLKTNNNESLSKEPVASRRRQSRGNTGASESGRLTTEDLFTKSKERVDALSKRIIESIQSLSSTVK